MLPRPPDQLVRKMLPLLAKIVGIAFIVVGTIFLLIGFVLLFTHKENTTLVGSIFIAGSAIHIALGVVVVRYVPRFMLGILQALRDKS